MTTTNHPVRVTIECPAHHVKGGVWRLHPEGVNGHTLLLDCTVPGVTIDHLPAPRDWRTDDVVQWTQHADGFAHTLVRQHGGTWTGGPTGHLVYDDDVTELVDHATPIGAGRAVHSVLVLRYAAGDEQRAGVDTAGVEHDATCRHEPVAV